MLKVETSADSIKVNVEAERLDILDSTNFLNELQKVIESSQVDIYLNLEELEFIDSAILGVLVRAHETSSDAGLKLYFENLTPFVNNLFVNSRMDTIFNIK